MDTNKFEFTEISGMDNYAKYIDQITQLTGRSKDDIFYLLFMNKRSRAFCIMSEQGDIVGFQGWVYKPIVYNNALVPTYRSEFTITASELRGTGVFPSFYDYTIKVLHDMNNHMYLWGQTGHKGWLRFGFKMIKRYSFYQIFSTKFKNKISKPELFNNIVINTFCVLFSKLNPIRLFIRSGDVYVSDQISYEEFKKYYSSGKFIKMKLYFDKELFHWRYIENRNYEYLYIKYKDSMIIISVTNSCAKITDIYITTIGQYTHLITYLIKNYNTVIFFGNIFSQYKAPFFWINQLMGFSSLLFGGSYVEKNNYAKEITWKNNPLFEAWNFGVEDFS